MPNVISVLQDWLSSFTRADAIGLALTLGLTLAVIILVRLALPAALSRISRGTGWQYAPETWIRLVTPLWLAVALFGLWALLEQIPLPEAVADRYHRGISLAVTAAFILLVLMGLLRLTRAVADHYRLRLRSADDSRVAYVNAIRKLVNLTILVLGLMVLLGQLGYEITPLLASLGVAGIAIALALKDTLSNLFAGLYLALDRPISPGQYIKLDSGEEGFVEEIGWRTTRILTWQNNIVLIPNEKLSQTVITNWHLTNAVMSVYINCGVAYDSDLREVERVCIEVGQQVMASDEAQDPEWTPVVRFQEFGDSNVKFVVVLRVVEPEASYRMKHEFIKALHERFRREDIEISWPVRKLVFASGLPGDAATGGGEPGLPGH